MNRIKNFSALFMLTILFAGALIIAGCGENKNENTKTNVNTDNQRQLPPTQTIPSFVADTSSKRDVKTELADREIVRKGVIDLKAIDQNKDGKVFECQMDYNVISDNAGTCPQCKMELEEVSLKKAKENLKASDFKVK